MPPPPPPAAGMPPAPSISTKDALSSLLSLSSGFEGLLSPVGDSEPPKPPPPPPAPVVLTAQGESELDDILNSIGAPAPAAPVLSEKATNELDDLMDSLMAHSKR
eukprot:TRINITY_DN3122_c0_g1_i6.p2 TRINITY_DN3122_c0_g1~~TRINITY_DN3122_c0_g1_i6.p2  ORF type:complete len:121 (+),score=44.67 TRINITY_DN3122_c0_g1_i6:49-363(+)